MASRVSPLLQTIVVVAALSCGAWLITCARHPTSSGTNDGVLTEIPDYRLRPVVMLPPITASDHSYVFHVSDLPPEVFKVSFLTKSVADSQAIKADGYRIDVAISNCEGEVFYHGLGCVSDGSLASSLRPVLPSSKYCGLFWPIGNFRSNRGVPPSDQDKYPWQITITVPSKQSSNPVVLTPILCGAALYWF